MNERENPYDASEKRVCVYLQELFEGQIGCGDDPVGFLIASHAIINYRLAEVTKIVRQQIEEYPERRDNELKAITDFLDLIAKKG